MEQSSKSLTTTQTKPSKDVDFLKSKIVRTVGLEPFRSKTSAVDFVGNLVRARNDVINGNSVDIASFKDCCELLERSENEVPNWVAKQTSELFTFKDCAIAFWTKQALRLSTDQDHIELDDEEISSTYALCDAICFLYYRSKDYSPEQAAELTFDMPPDHTRPHGWENVEYFGVGEALAALITRSQKGSNIYHDKVREVFHKSFFEKLPQQYSLRDFKIPYDFYSTCWDDAHSPDNIKPWSIEFCVYYVMQNELPLHLIFDAKAPRNYNRLFDDDCESTLNKIPNSLYYMWPSFKYFDVVCLTRFLSIWELYEKILADQRIGWDELAFIRHCESKFKFFEPPYDPEAKGISPSDFYWHGIEPQNHCDSFQDLFEHSLSFFGDLLNKFSFAILLEAQIKAFAPVWKKKVSDASLNYAFQQLFHKQKELYTFLQTKTDLKKKDCPKEPHYNTCLLEVTKLLPITPEHADMEKDVKATWVWVFKQFLEDYEKRLKFSDLMYLFESSKQSKSIALDGMRVIYPDRTSLFYDVNMPEQLLKGKKEKSPQKEDQQVDKYKVQFTDEPQKKKSIMKLRFKSTGKSLSPRSAEEKALHEQYLKELEDYEELLVNQDARLAGRDMKMMI